VLGAVLAVGCASSGRGWSSAHDARVDPTPRLEDVFDGEPALLVVVRPTRLARDPLYGPLFRRAGELAAARSGVGGAVGTTTLRALEQSDEVLVGIDDPHAKDAVVALRGVPANLEPSRLLDTNGAVLWAHYRDWPRGVEELTPADASVEASLFALPRRAWVIAVGGARERARAAYDGRTEENSLAPSAITMDAEPLAVARLRGDAIVRLRPSLAEGALAEVVRALDFLTISLQPGPEGQVGEVVARFVYAGEPFAERAQGRVEDVLAAFTRTYEKSAPWLHAVKVSREERAVVVRGRIPRAWADGFLHLDLDAK
jgi:hypothetical protein